MRTYQKRLKGLDKPLYLSLSLKQGESNRNVKKVCDKYSWGYYNCNSSQACKYITHLSKFMEYTSIVNYYQAVIFYHNVKGLPIAGWSDKLLSQTFKGIKNTNPYVDNAKDPVRPEHSHIMAGKHGFVLHVNYLDNDHYLIQNTFKSVSCCHFTPHFIGEGSSF